MSGFRVIYVVDGVVRHWWEVADVDTTGYREKFNRLPEPDGQTFNVRVSSQDEVKLAKEDQILVIQPGPEFRLIGPKEFMPPLGTRVD